MTDRTRRLDQARAQLDELPGLHHQLARCLTEKPADGNGLRGTFGSRPPLRLDVLHLTDARYKPGWWGDDPRAENPADRYGTLPELALWTRAVCEDRRNADLHKPDLADTPTVASECGWLATVWDYIRAQPYADDLADDLDRLTRQTRAALGERVEYQPRCRKCHDRVRLVDGDGKPSTPELFAYGQCAGCGHTYPKGPAMDALGRTQPAVTLKAAAHTLGLPVQTLHRWHSEGRISPAPETNGSWPRRFDLADIRAVATRLDRGRALHNSQQ